MVVSMMAGLAGTAGAQIVGTVAHPNFLTGDFNECYFPAVSNGEVFDEDLGASQTSITVQNIDNEDGFIFIWRGTGTTWVAQTYAQLNMGASKTFTGAQLGVPAGTVAPIIVASYDNIHSTGAPYWDDDWLGVACVAKQAVTGNNLPYTSAADTSVSGYNAVSGREVNIEDSIWDGLYLPIAQTNCGPGGCWNSVIRVANVGMFQNAAVTIRFFPATEYAAGSLQSGFQIQRNLGLGEVWSVDLADLLQSGEEWVGSVHVYSDDYVVGMVDRYKAGTDMWITNTASSAGAETNFQSGWPYALFAPDVRTDYNGWNTGISVANVVPWDNDVSIQYVGANAPAAKSAQLHAHGMTFFYNPSSPSEDRCLQPAQQVPGCEYIGAALILSSDPVAAVIDGVKYFGNDLNVGQAFSYSATSNLYDWLAAPLVQRGNPTTGFGATSGINFLNPNPQATTVWTTWINPSGVVASNFADSIVWVPGFSTGFVYTMFHGNLPSGFVGSAWVYSENAPIAATTANVDYQVNGDGTAIWNLYNPCGLFRQAGECIWAPPLEPLPVTATITKYVICQDCDPDFDGVFEDIPVQGANVSASGWDDNGFWWESFGFTGPDGSVVLVVPAGEYWVNLDTLPGWVDQAYVNTGEWVTVAAGESVTLTNYVADAPLVGNGVLQKWIIGLGPLLGSIQGFPVAFRSEVIFCDADMIGIGMSGADVAASGDCDSPADAAWVASGGVDNFINVVDSTLAFQATVPAGRYFVCSAAEVTYPVAGPPGFETVGYDYMCDDWVYVLPGQTTSVFNDFSALAVGALDVYVTTDFGVQLIQVCLRDGDTNEVIECQTGFGGPGQLNSTGWFTFNVTAGNYVVTADDTIPFVGGDFETQDASIDYTLVGDYIRGFRIFDNVFPRDPADADVRIDLASTP